MDAASFADALSRSRPGSDALLALGLSRGEVDEMRASFVLAERPSPADTALPDPVLAELFRRYDASEVEIGMVRFVARPEPAGGGWKIGTVEADDLILAGDAGRLVVTDHADPRHVIWQCAANGARLLDALAEAAACLSAAMADRPDAADPERAWQRCTELAGGAAYSAFWGMLLGVD